MNVKMICTSSCIESLYKLQIKNRLNRIVLNEAYLLLINAHYQACLTRLTILRQIHCSLVCLTATLSSCIKLELKHMFNFIVVKTLRASNNRLNLQYLIQKVLERETVQESLINEIVQIYTIDLEQWQAIDMQFSARDICFVWFKRVEFVLIERFDCFFYHENLKLSEC